eukprot:TRINITY_DN2575_c0_g3_i2.p2 TRINITY_DN2575_c0_g3~~TRINITY_DN2575_c0_g3_i2.p2  ORF type:complete len:203 (-),score=-10.50 TRINITY_DN2575_c0_g3_i2:21-629(-)
MNQKVWPNFVLQSFLTYTVFYILACLKKRELKLVLSLVLFSSTDLVLFLLQCINGRFVSIDSIQLKILQVIIKQITILHLVLVLVMYLRLLCKIVSGILFSKFYIMVQQTKMRDFSMMLKFSMQKFLSQIQMIFTQSNLFGGNHPVYQMFSIKYMLVCNKMYNQRGDVKSQLASKEISLLLILIFSGNLQDSCIVRCNFCGD